MSRSRNLKPGFFKNELLVEQPFEYRLLFAGLWTLADREGLLEDRPTRIKMEIFPGDNVDVNSGLKALHDAGFIQRYEVEGKRYIAILAWAKHQNPHHKEAESVIPKPACMASKPEALGPCMMEEPEALGPCMASQPGASPSLAPENGSCKGGGTVLIPDSLNLIPDSKEEREKPTGRKRPQVELDTWLDSLPPDEAAVKPDDPIFGYARDAGIPPEFIKLAWVRFCEEMRIGHKRQRDWRAHFRNSVRNQWYRLWWFDTSDGGRCKLTTKGEQARRAFEAECRDAA